jgi:hypothetical protein
VKAFNANTLQYVPDIVPQNPADFPRYAQAEFLKLQTVIAGLIAGHLDVTTVAPTKPRNGDIRYADGTLWSPSAGGEGFYGYYAGSWKKLG